MATRLHTVSDSTHPLISVVIPTHNHASFLWEALHSLTIQTAPFSYEAIVVDDASTDQPKVVADHFNARYLRIEACNVCRARNVGTRAAKGEIIIYLDADNYLLPNFFAETITRLQNNEADVVYGRRRPIGEFELNQNYDNYNLFTVSLAALRLTGAIDTCSAIKKSILPAEPWDENIKRYTDWDFHLTNLERDARYSFIDEEIFAYRYHVKSDDEKRSQRDDYRYALHYIRQKHRPTTPLTEESGEVTLFVPLIGRYYCIDALLNCISGLDYPKEKITLLFTDNSNDAQFFYDHILPFIKKWQSLYKGIAVRRHYSPTIFDAHTPGQTTSDERVKTMVHLYNFVVDQSNTPFIFILEDDTTCPPETLHRLTELAQTYPEAVAATVVQRSRRIKYGTVAYEWENEEAKNLFYARTPGVAKITTSGTGCILLRTSEIRYFRFNYGTQQYGVDMMLGYQLHQARRFMVTDWQMQAPHHILAPNGKVYSLTFDSFDEPDSVFAITRLATFQYAPPFKSDLKPNSIAPQPAYSLLLHDIDSLDHLQQWLRQSALDIYQLNRLVLLPQTESVYDTLKEISWPAGTVLKSWQASLTVTANALAKENKQGLIIASALCQPSANLKLTLPHLLHQDNPIVFATEKITFDNARMRWSFDDTIISPHQLAVGSLNLAFFLPLYLSHPLFDEEYQASSEISGLSTVLTTQRCQTPCLVTPLLTCTRLDPLILDEQFYHTLGAFTNREIPYRRWYSFYRHTLLETWQTPTRLRRIWLASLIKNVFRRLRYHVPQHRLCLVSQDDVTGNK